MKTDQDAALQNRVEPAASLTEVLEQNEQARELVKESAEELSSVNLDLKQEIANQDTPPGIEDALRRSEAVEKKVEAASEKLAAVNQALESEVRDRELLHHQVAATVEQGQAARSSFHDVLTGLPNRALFNDRLEHGLAQARRHHWNVGVMFLALDEFANLNALHGTEAGDGILKTVAQRLKENARGDDTVSRIGGNEFLYLLMEIQDEKAIAWIAEKIIRAIQAPMIVKARGVDVSLRVKTNIGISIFPKDGNSVDTLIISADLAMVRAIRNGRGFSFAS